MERRINKAFILFCLFAICLCSRAGFGAELSDSVIDVECDEGNDGWCRSDARVTFHVNGGAGSSAAGIEYRLNGRVWTAYAAPVDLATEGATTIDYRSTEPDGIGTGPLATVVKIDKTPPAISASISALPNAGGWFNQDVTITYACDDAVSRIAACEYSKIITGDGAGQVISGAARDAAGNSATVAVILNIDKTAPTIRITGIEDGAVYMPGAVPVAGYEVFDMTSGVESRGASLLGGNAEGGTVYTYRVDASDKAGNSASATATYTVTYGFSGFLEPVSRGGPFRVGGTIPVKFRLTDSRGNSISTAHAMIMLQQYTGDNPAGEPMVLSAYGADPGNEFRYEAADDLYVFNLGTKDLAPGTWQIRVMLDDGSLKSAFILLKKD